MELDVPAAYGSTLTTDPGYPPTVGSGRAREVQAFAAGFVVRNA